MNNHDDRRQQDRGTRIATVVLSGILAGLTRAITDAFLHYFTTGH